MARPGLDESGAGNPSLPASEGWELGGAVLFACGEDLV